MKRVVGERMSGRNSKLIGGNSSKLEKLKAPHHTPHQIQQLKAFFEECPNPNDNQMSQLSKNLGLNQNQVRSWFQNESNQIKIRNNLLDNSALRSENERLQSQNLAFLEALRNAICPTCDDHPPVGEEERRLNMEIFRRENAHLREEYEKIANE